jgi:uncharacterized membrane protein (UPF0136 family)
MNKLYAFWITFFYGVLIFVFGLTGYITKGSKASLYSGLAFGLLLILGAILSFMRKKMGLYLSLFTTLLLTVVMSFRYVATQKIVPGTFAILSGAVLFILLISWLQMRKTNNPG